LPPVFIAFELQKINFAPVKKSIQRLIEKVAIHNELIAQADDMTERARPRLSPSITPDGRQCPHFVCLTPKS
jgi:hypothetical protein